MPRRSILFLAGDLAQLQLPVGLKDLNLRGTEVTGKATSEIILNTGLFGQPHTSPHSSPYFFSSSLLYPTSSLYALSRRGYRPTQASRGHAERELRVLHGPHRYGRVRV